MSNEINFDTYFYISSKKIKISIKQKDNLKSLFEEEMPLSKNGDKFNNEYVDSFLDENILKIEKSLNNFIKNVFLIIEHEDFFTFKMSIKKEYYGELFTSDNLIYLLNEARQQTKKTIEKKKIIHMLIDGYLIDNQYHQFLPKDFKCNDFSIDVRFICLSDIFIKNLENIFKKYHISISQIISANYINEFHSKSDQDIFCLTSKIVGGYNQNEVFIEDKPRKNKGFFEKFFYIFN
tara:strand:- start:491 stop:1195 length:705 start_codon:yes stop_codon:yes gene_type:complete